MMVHFGPDVDTIDKDYPLQHRRLLGPRDYLVCLQTTVDVLIYIVVLFTI